MNNARNNTESRRRPGGGMGYWDGVVSRSSKTLSLFLFIIYNALKLNRKSVETQEAAQPGAAAGVGAGAGAGDAARRRCC